MLFFNGKSERNDHAEFRNTAFNDGRQTTAENSTVATQTGSTYISERMIGLDVDEITKEILSFRPHTDDQESVPRPFYFHQPPTTGNRRRNRKHL